MRRAVRFLVILVIGLGGLAVVGYVVLARTTRSWFEHDLALRSLLAVSAARQSLQGNWSAGRERLTETLTDITRDERIMAAAACTPEGQLLAVTEAYPADFSCRSV